MMYSHKPVEPNLAYDEYWVRYGVVNLKTHNLADACRLAAQKCRADSCSVEIRGSNRQVVAVAVCDANGEARVYWRNRGLELTVHCLVIMAVMTGAVALLTAFGRLL